MNERIKELAEQVGVNCVVPTVGTLEYPNKGEVDHLKKFAQLIVEQCATIIESQDVDPSFKLRMSWAVKQYFGVEE